MSYNCDEITGLQCIDPPPVTPPTPPNPPTGFQTWEDYLDYKCKVANWIFDSSYEFFNQIAAIPIEWIGYGELIAAPSVIAALENIFRNWKATALNTTGPITGTIIVGLLLVYLPEWVLTAIASLIVGLFVVAGTVAAKSYFENIATELTNSKADTVCALYNSQSPSEAQAIMDNLLISIIANVVTTIAPTAGRTINQMTPYMSMNASVNKLFEKDSKLLTYTGTVDCEGCNNPSCEYLFDTNLEGWETVPTYRAISHSSIDGGVMVLDGRGAGGPNWSGGRILASEIAACLGVTEADLILSWLRWEIVYRNLNTTFETNLQAYTIPDSGNNIAHDSLGIHEEYTTKVVDYPGDSRLLLEFHLYSGNQTISQTEEFISYVREVLLFYTP